MEPTASASSHHSRALSILFMAGDSGHDFYKTSKSLDVMKLQETFVNRKPDSKKMDTCTSAGVGHVTPIVW